MKHLTLFTALTTATLLFTPLAFAEAEKEQATSQLEWNVVKTWDVQGTPIDVVHSLDNRYVFFLTKENQVLIYTSKGKLEGAIPVDKGVTSIDIEPRAELLYLIDKEKNTFSALSIDFVRSINTTGSPTKGPADAPVTMVVFTDFECPYCKKLEPLLGQIQERNSKNVRLVFKNLPLSFHKFADPAARAALAAEEQGKFWEFHDALFTSQKLDNAIIEGIAKNLNLDVDKWKKAMDSQEVKARVAKDIKDAEKAGVTGTPTVFINGKALKNKSPQGFQQAITQALNKK